MGYKRRGHLRVHGESKSEVEGSAAQASPPYQTQADVGGGGGGGDPRRPRRLPVVRAPARAMGAEPRQRAPRLGRREARTLQLQPALLGPASALHRSLG